MQNLLTVLLLIDVLLTLALLEVETEYPACSDALHVCKSANQCHGDPHNIARAKVALRVASQCILALFAAEMIVLIAVTGLRFFREPLYVFDFVVVAVAVALELTLERRHHISALLVFARAWRFISLLHSMDSMRHLRVQISTPDDDSEPMRRPLQAS